MLMKKLVLLSIVSFSCWAAMPWETGWAMGGTSTYAINDKENNQLLIECNDQGGFLYLRDEKRNEIKLGQAVSIGVNNTKLMVPMSIDATSTNGDKTAWGNFIYSLFKSKSITINNKKFEPNNSEKLSDIAQTCTAYDENTNNSQQNKILPTPSNQVPVQLKVQNFPANLKTGQIYQFVNIDVISKVNNVQINNIIVNRGNCKTNALNVKLPQHLKFGEQYKGTYQSCNAIEVEVVTDHGNWVFNLSN